MATDPTGEVRHSADGFAARVTWKGGKDRRTFALPHASDLAAAKERANVLARMTLQFRRNGVIDDPRALELAKLAASASSPSTLGHVLQVAGELVGGELKLVAPKASSDPTVKDIAERWLALRRTEAERGDHAGSTITANEEHLQYHILPALGATPISSLSSEPERLRRFVAVLRDTPRTRSGPNKTRVVIEGSRISSLRVRNICSTLRKLFDDAIAEGWVRLAANPMRHPAVKVPRAVTLANGEVIFIERDDAAALLRCVAGERHAFYVVGLLAGLDVAEIAGLANRHLDLDGEVATVRVDRCFTQAGEYGPTKRPSRVRVVPLHPLAVAALRDLRSSLAEALGRPLSASDPIFASVVVRNGERVPLPRYRHGASYLLRADLKRAGRATQRNGHKITAKSMRKSFATWLHEAGVEEGLVGRLMGHAAKTVTSKHYTASDLRRLHEAVCRIRLDADLGSLMSDPMPPGSGGDDHPRIAPSTSSDASTIGRNTSKSLCAPTPTQVRTFGVGLLSTGPGRRRSRGPPSRRRSPGCSRRRRFGSVSWTGAS